MDNKTCPKCGARWFEGQLYWSTGKLGKSEDLAGLVCNDYGDVTCINEDKGVVTPEQQTWEKRRKALEDLAEKIKEMDDLR
jgi:predicted nucleic-acid-binding Zn-ribbon protein